MTRIDEEENILTVAARAEVQSVVLLVLKHLIHEGKGEERDGGVWVFDDTLFNRLMEEDHGVECRGKALGIQGWFEVVRQIELKHQLLDSKVRFYGFSPLGLDTVKSLGSVELKGYARRIKVKERIRAELRGLTRDEREEVLTLLLDEVERSVS